MAVFRTVSFCTHHTLQKERKRDSIRLRGVFPHLATLLSLQVVNNTNSIDSSCKHATLLLVFILCIISDKTDLVT